MGEVRLREHRHRRVFACSYGTAMHASTMWCYLREHGHRVEPELAQRDVWVVDVTVDAVVHGPRREEVGVCLGVGEEVSVEPVRQVRQGKA